MSEIKRVKPSGIFTNYIFKSIPLAFDESMSYYETLCGVLDLLKNTVDVVNNNAELLEELDTYVRTYFDNLDVQEEINNKLDEMAESGELEELIADYLNSKAIFGFDNVASMKNATNLINGSYARTLGYYAKNDGGEATYKIRNITNDDIIDERFIIEINDEQNQLVAELIYKSPINILSLGAKRDGSSDTSSIINSATTKTEVFIPEGHYLVNDEITLQNSLIGETYHRGGVRDNSKGSILISNITCNYENRQTKAVLNINNSIQIFNISNITIKLKEYECGIKGVNLNSNNIYIENTTVSNVKSTGIYITSSKSKVPELNNITIVGTGESYEDSVGIYVNCPDYKINNLDVLACRKGCQFSGFVQGGNFHIWCGAIQGEDGILNHTEDHSWFKGTVGLYVNYCQLDNVYLDTIYQKIKNNGLNNPNVKSITNLITLDDASMNSVPDLAGRNFDTGINIIGHTNYVTPINKTLAFSDDVNYINENVVLYITENEYFAQNKVGGTKYYDVRYKFTKNITGTSNDIIEIAKVKVDNNCGGCVDINVLHIKNRPHKITLKFINGSYMGGSFESYGQTDEKCYITTTKDANNIYKVYLKVNNRGDEYLSVGSDYNYKWSGINVIDLGYRTGENQAFNPETLSVTTNLTEIT